jgi:hypothetical protein
VDLVSEPPYYMGMKRSLTEMPDERFPPVDGLLPRLDPEEAGYLGEELESLRELVSRGDTLATAGGSVMAWWGLVLAVTHILKALMAADWIPAGLPVGWGAASIGVPVALLISHFGQGGYSFRSWRNQAISTTWVFAGIGIAAFLLGSQWTRVAEPHIVMAFLAIVFSLVLAVMATSSSQSWLLGVAGGWMLTACAMFVLNAAIDRYLVMAAATVCFMTAPGLILLRAEWRAQPKPHSSGLKASGLRIL